MEEQTAEEDRSRKTCSNLRFDGVQSAQAYLVYSIGRGSTYMANVTLTSAFIVYASQEAGCTFVNADTGDLEITPDCTLTTRGMPPASLIANIQVIAGILSAFLMPYVGAIIDCTSYRRTTGAIMAFVLTLIQAGQIGTTRRTWFVMAVLQGIAGTVFECLSLTVFSYLPEMARQMGEQRSTGFIRTLTQTQYSAQFLFLIISMALAVGFGWDDNRGALKLARATQGILTAILIVTFTWCWIKFPSVPPQRVSNGRLWISGFQQVISTAKTMYRDYRRSLFLFMLTIAIGEAFASSLTTLSVVYLGDALLLTSTQVILFFMCALVGMVIGPPVGTFLARRTDLKNSWRGAQIGLTLVNIVGALVLPPRALLPACCWGMIVGLFLGWHYTMQRAIFSIILPPGQDSELTGFFVYCQIILSWLPPLIYSAIVQSNVNQSFALLSLAGFGVAGVLTLSLMPSWSAVLKDVGKSDESLAISTGAAEKQEEAISSKVEELLSTPLHTNAALSNLKA